MQSFKLKDYNLGDTIAAIATFPSLSALGVIKVSGKKAFPIISKIFLPRRKKDMRKVKTYTLHYGWIMEKAQRHKVAKAQRRATNYIVDEVLVSVMRAPNSYTREDVVEISSHGGVLVSNKILEIILREGARLALPGEFTYRALAKGRIDLLQAESILDIVEARSEEGLKAAAMQLSGESSQKIKKIKDEIKEVFVETESSINFPEDDTSICLTQAKRKIKVIEKKINQFLQGGQEAKILKEGTRCVICGKVNTGKSTLFNRLLGEERVIVSNYAGTTRDVIEETINIRGIPLRIYDTAGILEPKDFIAKEAIEKSQAALGGADLVILLLDGSKSLGKDDYFLLEKVRNKNTILVINKIDLPQRIKNISKFKSYRVSLSALKNTGIEDLEKAIFKSIYKKGLHRQDMIFLSQYQRQSLKAAADNIVEARNFLDKSYPIDFVNLSLKSSLDNLGKLTGEVLTEEILEDIFSNFCIGK